MRRTISLVFIAALAAPALCGCSLTRTVGDAFVGLGASTLDATGKVAGATVGAAGKIAGAAVGATAKGAGAAIHTVTAPRKKR